jgi:methenyltetrahydromethanopterin cyclohydrolase
MNVPERATVSVRPRPSINAAAQPLVEALVRDASRLRVGVETHPGGCRIVDAGIRHPGGLEAGRRIAEI